MNPYRLKPNAFHDACSCYVRASHPAWRHAPAALQCCSATVRLARLLAGAALPMLAAGCDVAGPRAAGAWEPNIWRRYGAAAVLGLWWKPGAGLLGRGA